MRFAFVVVAGLLMLDRAAPASVPASTGQELALLVPEYRGFGWNVGKPFVLPPARNSPIEWGWRPGLMLRYADGSPVGLFLLPPFGTEFFFNKQ